MTSVLSLTAAASADYTFASSTLLFSEGNSASAINLSNLSALMSQDVGALWRRSTTVYSLSSVTWTTLRFGSLEYDTGSFTDSNSIGLFRIPDDKWKFVELGGNWFLNVGNSGATRIYKLVGTNSQPYAYSTYEYDAGFSTFGVSNYTIMEVSSGDVIACQAYVTGGASEFSELVQAWWIRGYSARG